MLCSSDGAFYLLQQGPVMSLGLALRSGNVGFQEFGDSRKVFMEQGLGFIQRPGIDPVLSVVTGLAEIGVQHACSDRTLSVFSLVILEDAEIFFDHSGRIQAIEGELLH